VVTKMVAVAPAESVGLIIAHLLGHAEQIARHRYGCRIFCRLLQRSSKSKLPGLEGLLEEVLLKAPALCCHTFAHHVIESVLENSRQHEHQHKIFQALCSDLHRCAQDRYGSFVIQAALQCCCARDVKILADSLIDMLPSLATTRFGSNVYNNLCAQESTKSSAIAKLKEAAPMLLESTYGRKLVKQVLGLGVPAESATGWPELQPKEFEPYKSIKATGPAKFASPSVTSFSSTASTHTPGSSFGSSGPPTSRLRRYGCNVEP